MFYVYEWFVKESGEVFYVGKGTKNRYKVKKHNKFFNDFITRCECESRIIKTFDNEQDAFAYEFERVNELKAKGQCVCNIYQGGLGGTTSWWTDEMRDNYSKNNVMKSGKQRKRMSENNPMKNKEVSEKVKKKNKRKVCVGEKVYDGVIDVAKEYGIKDTAIQYWLQRGYSSDLKPCYYYGEKVPEIKLKNHITNTKKVYVDDVLFNTVKEAAKSINTDPSVLIRSLKENRPCKGHICRYDNQQPSQTKSDNSSLEGSTTNE
jgi:hypothetical protein